MRKGPNYNFAIDCHKNMANAYEQGRKDMKLEIEQEITQSMTKENYLSIIPLLMKIRQME